MKRSNNLYWSLGVGILWLAIGLATIVNNDISLAAGLTTLAAGIAAGALLVRAFTLLRMNGKGS